MRDERGEVRGEVRGIVEVGVLQRGRIEIESRKGMGYFLFKTSNFFLRHTTKI